MISLGKKAGGRHFQAWLSYSTKSTRPQAHLPTPVCWPLSPGLSPHGLKVATATPAPLSSTTAFKDREWRRKTFPLGASQGMFL